MAESVVSIAAERLGDLVVQEAKFLGGVSGQIELIQLELELMQTYLEDADKRQIQDKRVQTWISKIKETAYDVEDILETFLLKIGSRRRGGIKNVFKRYACILNEAAELHKVGSQIEDIKTRITTLTRCLKTYGIKHIREGEEGPSSVNERQRQLRQSYSHEVEEYTVGLNDNIKNLVEQLVENKCRAVSICGMGGLGKTTLAKKVYHHQGIRQHFGGLSWTFISQQFEQRNVLEGILLDVTSPSEEEGEPSEKERKPPEKGTKPSERERIKQLSFNELLEELHGVQRKKKCLVILDDIWSEEAWHSLKRAFPVEISDTKILLTTRNKEVALHVDPNGFCLEPECLKEEEGWKLFQKKAFPRDAEGKIDEEMQKLGAEMVKRCAGLPLAIVVLGGILATKHKDEWERVNNHITSFLNRDKGHETRVREILALSYNELPYRLKTCFLYLGHFPEDFSIPTKKLVRMWVAEGLVLPMQYKVKGAETLEEIAECYLGELLNRNMVQVGEKGSTGRVKTCRLHDLMRDLCLLKANEENFLEIFDNQDGNELMGDSLSSTLTSAKRIRRITILCKEAKDKNIFLKSERTPYLRSMLVHGANVFVTKMVNELRNFKLLKVLDLEVRSFETFPRAIGDLIHLRYLNFKIAVARKVINIPSSFGNLRCLQTLIINIDEILLRDIFQVPNIIWKMKRLRHLCLPDSLNRVKLRLGNLREVQTLNNFDARHFDVEELTELTSLRKVEIDHLSSFKKLEGILEFHVLA